MWGCIFFFFNMSRCVSLAAEELHSTLEAVRQRHRQRTGLRSRGHVRQGHLCRGQQGHCKRFKVQRSQNGCSPPLCEMMCLWLPSVSVLQVEDMVAEIKWAFEENLKYVSWMDLETKKAAKEKVGERRCVFLSQQVGMSSGVVGAEVAGKYSTATWCENRTVKAFYFLFYFILLYHRQMQYTTWSDIRTSSWTRRTWTKCSMM